MLSEIVKVFQLIPLFVQYLILPLILMSILLIIRYRCKLAWIIIALVTLSYLILLHFSAVWEMSVGFYTRYILEVLLLIVCIYSYRKLKGKPFLVKTKIPGYLGYGIGFFALIVFTILNVTNFRACIYHEEVVKLAFPFHDGTYLINDGGDGSISRLMNYHYQDENNIRRAYNKAQRYANDIMKLDAFGFEGKNFAVGNEKDLNSYYIYDETVYSPCDGEVYFVQDGHADIMPNQTVVDTGNGVVIKMGDVFIQLWHLKKDSILVKQGDMVKIGEPLGKIGNSGITKTPHLHIEACTKHWLYGDGVPIFYDSKNPIKNSLYKK